MELGIIHSNRVIILGCGNGIGRHDRLVMVKIQKPDETGDQQEDNEHDELFLLVHAAVLKSVLRCSATLITFVEACVGFSEASVKESTAYRLAERCRPFRNPITLL